MLKSNSVHLQNQAKFVSGKAEIINHILFTIRIYTVIQFKGELNINSTNRYNQSWKITEEDRDL